MKSLLSKLRIGLAEQTVLASLGRAMVFEGCGEANERCDDDIGGKTPIGDMASAEFATFLVDAEKQVKTMLGILGFCSLMKFACHFRFLHFRFLTLSLTNFQ